MEYSESSCSSEISEANEEIISSLNNEPVAKKTKNCVAPTLSIRR